MEWVQDFVFAREVRLGSYRVATVPPAALVAAKCMAEDPRMEPAHGERVRTPPPPTPHPKPPLPPAHPLNAMCLQNTAFFPDLFLVGQVCSDFV